MTVGRAWTWRFLGEIVESGETFIPGLVGPVLSCIQLHCWHLVWSFLDFYTPCLCLSPSLSLFWLPSSIIFLPFKNKCMSIVHDTILLRHLLLNIIASLPYY